MVLILQIKIVTEERKKTKVPSIFTSSSKIKSVVENFLKTSSRNGFKIEEKVCSSKNTIYYCNICQWNYVMRQLQAAFNCSRRVKERLIFRQIAMFQCSIERDQNVCVSYKTDFHLNEISELFVTINIFIFDQHTRNLSANHMTLLVKSAWMRS